MAATKFNGRVFAIALLLREQFLRQILNNFYISFLFPISNLSQIKFSQFQHLISIAT